MSVADNTPWRISSTLRQTVREAGFIYLGLMVVIAIMGIALAATGEVWHMALKREKEKELLFVGNQFRNAINHFYQTSRRFPMSLDDLLKDPNSPATRRYLRKIYVDPITGDSTWGMIKGPAGEIFGVYSLSDDEPIKRSNFSAVDSNFEGKLKYSDWVFMSTTKNFASPISKPTSPLQNVH